MVEEWIGECCERRSTFSANSDTLERILCKKYKREYIPYCQMIVGKSKPPPSTREILYHHVYAFNYPSSLVRKRVTDLTFVDCTETEIRDFIRCKDQWPNVGGIIKKYLTYTIPELSVDEFRRRVHIVDIGKNSRSYAASRLYKSGTLIIDEMYSSEDRVPLHIIEKNYSFITRGSLYKIKNSSPAYNKGQIVQITGKSKVSKSGGYLCPCIDMEEPYERFTVSSDDIEPYIYDSVHFLVSKEKICDDVIINVSGGNKTSSVMSYNIRVALKVCMREVFVIGVHPRLFKELETQGFYVDRHFFSTSSHDVQV